MTLFRRLSPVLLVAVFLSPTAHARDEHARDERGNRTDSPTLTQRVGNALDRGAITADVKARLLADERTKGFDINVGTEVNRGYAVVVLEGTAPSRASKQAATEVARRVSGVREVRNRLVITSHRTDHPRTLSAKTQRVLEDDGR